MKNLLFVLILFSMSCGYCSYDVYHKNNLSKKLGTVCREGQFSMTCDRLSFVNDIFIYIGRKDYAEKKICEEAIQKD